MGKKHGEDAVGFKQYMAVILDMDSKDMRDDVAGNLSRSSARRGP